MQDNFATSRFDALVDLTSAEMRALAGLRDHPRALARGAVLQAEGDAVSRLHLLHGGWAASALSLCDGRRQIVALHLAGDLLGGSSLPYARACETIVAVTDITVSAVPLDRLAAIFADHPRLATILFLGAQEDRMSLMERLASIGRQPALQRVAALLTHLYDRLRRIDAANGRTILLPLTQDEIGDVLGLTSVHINRMLRELTARGLIARQAREIELRDVEGLRALAELPPRLPLRNPAWMRRLAPAG